LVATGAPADRRVLGKIILKSWLRTLERGAQEVCRESQQKVLEEFMYQSMAAGHSANFLSKNEKKLDEWVKHAATANNCMAILSIVRDTHTDDITSPWHTINLAKEASSNGGFHSNKVLFIAGSEDILAHSEQVEILANIGNWRCETISGAGHAVLLEQPELWRRHVLNFLDNEN